MFGGGGSYTRHALTGMKGMEVTDLANGLPEGWSTLLTGEDHLVSSIGKDAQYYAVPKPGYM